MPAFYEWTVKLRLPNTLVARGETVDREQLEDWLTEKLDADPDIEPIRVLMVKEPDESQIRREQS